VEGGACYLPAIYYLTVATIPYQAGNILPSLAPYHAFSYLPRGSKRNRDVKNGVIVITAFHAILSSPCTAYLRILPAYQMITGAASACCRAICTITCHTLAQHNASAACARSRRTSENGGQEGGNPLAAASAALPLSARHLCLYTPPRTRAHLLPLTTSHRTPRHCNPVKAAACSYNLPASAACRRKRYPPAACLLLALSSGYPPGPEAAAAEGDLILSGRKQWRRRRRTSWRRRRRGVVSKPTYYITISVGSISATALIYRWR